ncbi:hypothetical protein H6F61_01910 [Cyanobacteria bacterium FACHB-472]|nr:hypothetical protein [Cyanobacteria bacterium FACHB-472]
MHLIQTTQNESNIWTAAESLGRIDPGNKIAIATLVKLVQTSEQADWRRQAACSLGEIHASDETAVATLIQFIQTVQDENEDEYFLRRLADSFKRISQTSQLMQVVTALKDYLDEQVFKNCFYRFEACDRIIWHCSQNLTYPDFYEAWHN